MLMLKEWSGVTLQGARITTVNVCQAVAVEILHVSLEHRQTCADE